MKIVIIGPGALGSLFAAFLAAVDDNEVWLLDHDPQRAASLHGKLLLTVGEQEFCRSVSATADAAAIGSADLVLHCVKSRDVAEGLQQALPLFTPKTTLISFQNGISHLDILSGAALPVTPAIGVTAMGATLAAPGHVCHGGEGITRVGFMEFVSAGTAKRLGGVVNLFQSVGLPAEMLKSIVDVVWTKLLINVGINALTVIFDCPNGRLLSIAKAREMLEAAVLEGREVACALGIKVPDDPVGQALEVCRATANNVSSMLQDVRRSRPTEIDAINGALLAKAEKLGIDTPVNRELVERVRRIEGGYLQTAPHEFSPGRP